MVEPWSEAPSARVKRNEDAAMTGPTMPCPLEDLAAMPTAIQLLLWIARPKGSTVAVHEAPISPEELRAVDGNEPSIAIVVTAFRTRRRRDVAINQTHKPAGPLLSLIDPEPSHPQIGHKRTPIGLAKQRRLRPILPANAPAYSDSTLASHRPQQVRSIIVDPAPSVIGRAVCR
jgi:hypothetical protein